MSTPTAPPGWYPDPSGQPGQRYFDGQRWTQHRAPGPHSSPLQTQSKSKAPLILGVIGAVLALFVVIGVVGGSGDDAKKSPTATRPSTSSAPITAAPAPASEPVGPTVAPAGSAVRDGKFEFQVLDIARAKSVSDPTGNPYMTATAQGEFIVVTMSVRNIGNEAANYFGQNQKLTDASGREYAAHNMADMWMNNGLSIMGDINPGNAIQVKVAFDVPPGTQATELALHDSMFSGGVSVRLV